MKSEIDAILALMAGGSPSATHTRSQGAEFEMWLLLKIAERLHGPPFNAELRDSAANPIPGNGAFVLSGNAGKIGSGSACHVGIDWKSQPHEFHANIQFRGRSGETHEIDISLIPSSIANPLRAIAGGGRPTGQPRVALECKFKPGNGAKDEARQYVARQFDMHFLAGHQYPSSGARPSIWPEGAVALGAGRRWVYYSQSFSRCFNGLCRLGGVSGPVGRFLDFNSVVPYPGLAPGTAEMNDFLDRIERFLQQKHPY